MENCNSTKRKDRFRSFIRITLFLLILAFGPTSYLLYGQSFAEAKPSTEIEKVLEPNDRQDFTVTGQVTDASSDEGLPGVNVMVKGTTTGTSTDADGSYSLTAPSQEDTLVFSFIGYATQEIPIDGRSQIDVQLQLETYSGENVVVIGYGTSRKESLTGSVSSVSGEDLTNIPSSRVDQIMQGRAAGVRVTQTSGEPGAQSVIRVRGSNSIQGDNSPLYVIDGAIVGTNFNLNNLNTNDIESIEVLKDATATAIYGTRGSNGVVLITTKSGRGAAEPGKPEISFNTYTGMQYMMNSIDMLSGPQHAAYANEDAEFRGASLPFDDPGNVPNINWVEQITRDAPLTNTDISVSGQSADRDISYYVSGNYYNQRGLIRNSGIEKYNFRTNLDFDISDHFRTGLKLNTARLINDNNKVNLSAALYRAALPERAIYDEDEAFTAVNPVSASVYRNPEADIQLKISQNSTTNVLGNLYAEVEPVENLVIRSTFSPKIRYTKYNRYNPGQLPEHAVINDGGDGRVEVSTSTEILNENTVSYATAIGENHDIDLLGGFTWQTSEAEGVNARAFGFANDALEYNDLGTGSDPTRNVVGSGWNSYQLVSWLGRANYAFQDKYRLTLVGRVDGSSRFAGSNNEYGFFPSAAVAWHLDQEPFINQSDFFDVLKLRASYGLSGSQAIGSFRTLSLLNGTGTFFNNTEQSAVQSGRPANKSLKWETTSQFDVGLEASIFGGRLSFEADYYRKKTEDLLLNVQVPRQTGFTSRLQNLGSIRNQGLEFKINSVNITGNDFEWSSMVTIFGNRNEVLDLGGSEYIDVVSPTSGGPGGRLIVGESVPVFVGVEYLGTWKSQQQINESGQSAQQVGGPRFKDTDGNGDVNIDDFEVLGSPEPDFSYGLQNTFAYKNWSLDLFIQGTYGNEIYNSLTQSAYFGRPEANKYSETLDRWTPDNSDSDVPRAGTVATLSSVYSNSKMVEDGTHLRLKNLQLNYSLPVQKWGLNEFKNITMYFSGTNLLLLSDFRLFDPEVSQYGDSNTAIGFSQGEYPYGRTLTIGVRATL